MDNSVIDDWISKHYLLLRLVCAIYAGALLCCVLALLAPMRGIVIRFAEAVIVHRSLNYAHWDKLICSCGIKGCKGLCLIAACLAGGALLLLVRRGIVFIIRALRSHIRSLFVHALRLAKNHKVQASIMIILLCALCIVYSLINRAFLGFYPINGTFQNYNPVRRLLAGQVPYRDFYDYLGLGHLFLGSLFTWLFDGTYGASLIAFNLLTLLSFASFSILLCHAATRSWRQSLCITLLAIVLDRTLPFLYFAWGPANSARLIRAFAPIVFVLAVRGGGATLAMQE